ncbi:MAG: hypothetical protein AAF580_12710 [Pseudomonadota bacterium]
MRAQAPRTPSPEGEVDRGVVGWPHIEGGKRCLTEVGVLWLASGAVVISATLWLAILTVL